MTRHRLDIDKSLPASLGCLLAFAPAFLLAVLWHWKNVSYPRPDPSDYFATTQEIWLMFRDGGALRAIDQAYLHRNWRQILHPALASPFLILTGGRVLASLALFSVACLICFLGYTYRLFRIALPPSRAIVGTWLISFVPWLFATFMGFGAEALLFPCVVAAAFHFYASEGLTNRRQSKVFGAWVGVAICARPVESVFILVLPLLFWFVRENWGKRRWWGPLIPVAALFAIFIVYFALSAKLGPEFMGSWRIPAALLLLAAPAYLFLKSKASERGLVAATCAAYLVVVFWFGPRAWELFHWVQVTTFSEFAAATGGEGLVPFSEYARQVFVDPGRWFALFTAVCAAFAARRAWRERQTRSLFLALLLTWSALFFLELSTSNRDPRYFLGVWILTLIGGVSLALSEQGKFARQRFGLLALFAAGALFHLYANQAPMNSASGFQKRDTAEQVVEDLAKLMPNDRAVHIAEINLDKQGFEDAPINPQTLMIIARERGLRWTIDGIGFGSHGKNLSEIELHLAKTYDALFLAPASGGGAPHSVFQSALHGEFGASLAAKTRRGEKTGLFSFLGRFAYDAWGAKDEIFVYWAKQKSL